MRPQPLESPLGAEAVADLGGGSVIVEIMSQPPAELCLSNFVASSFPAKNAKAKRENEKTSTAPIDCTAVKVPSLRPLLQRLQSTRPTRVRPNKERNELENQLPMPSIE